VLGLGAALYVVGLSAVLAWVSGRPRRGRPQRPAARDWYLLAAGIGLPIAPLLAFTLVSALR
jgi:drug/metabolite transporter (DMT)-like permease